MIIDAHAHLSLFSSGDFTRKERLEHLKKFRKKAGIEKTLVFATIAALENKPLRTKELVDLLQDEKGFYVVAGISVDIAKKDLEELEGFLKRKEIVAIKIYPGYEPFYPSDSRLDKAFDLCERYDVPLIVHSGDTLGTGSGVKYSHPLAVDDLAVKRPNMKIVIAHLGNPWLTDTMEVLYRHKNVYADTSALVWKEFDAYWSTHYEKNIIHILKWVSYNRLMFGTDWPCNDETAYDTYIKGCADFFKHVRLPKQDKEHILHLNAEKVFGI